MRVIWWVVATAAWGCSGETFSSGEGNDPVEAGTAGQGAGGSPVGSGGEPGGGQSAGGTAVTGGTAGTPQTAGAAGALGGSGAVLEAGTSGSPSGGESGSGGQSVTPEPQPEAGPPCPEGQKLCEGDCVPTEWPSGHGCSPDSCDRCEWSDNLSGGSLTCVDGQCAAVCPEWWEPKPDQTGCQIAECPIGYKRCGSGGACEPITTLNGCDPTVRPQYDCSPCGTIGNGTCAAGWACP